MKILITTPEHTLSIPFPTALLLSRPCLRLWLRLARGMQVQANRCIPDHLEQAGGNYLDNIPDEAVYAICGELNRLRKLRGGWNLAEVETTRGVTVLIRV